MKMRKLVLGMSAASLVFGGSNIGGLTAFAGEGATLVRAELHTRTNDDNKDKDTGVFVYVTDKNGTSQLAKIENADNSSRDETEYNDHSAHTVGLVVVNTGATKAFASSFNVVIAQSTNGRDTWKFNATVTLFFSDGTTLVKNRDGITLVNNGASVAF